MVILSLPHSLLQIWNISPYQYYIFEDWRFLVTTKSMKKKIFFEAESKDNASVDDTHWKIGIVVRVDDMEEKFKIAHGFVEILMILDFVLNVREAIEWIWPVLVYLHT